MRRRQTETPIHFACIRLPGMLPGLLGPLGTFILGAFFWGAFFLGAFVPALHSQANFSTMSTFSDSQAGLNGTGILASSGYAMNENVGAVNQTITATYSGSLYSAAGNPSLASLKLQAIVSAQRAVALVPGSGRLLATTTNAANRAGAGYVVAAHAIAYRAPMDPMAELSQSIGPAYGQGQHPGYMPAVDHQPLSANVYASGLESGLEQIGGLEKIGGQEQFPGLEKMSGFAQDGIESFASGFGASERLCGQGCGLTEASKVNSASRDRRKQNSAAMRLKSEDKIQKLDLQTTVSTELKTGTN